MKYNLNRFVEAQNHVYEQVLNELRQGRKTSHWMWYIFPQIKGLQNKTAEAIFGDIDAMKLKSSMTLFSLVSDNPVLIRSWISIIRE